MQPEILPFLFLNHRLEPARLRARIAEIGAAGCDGFFIHAREGLGTPYLSREWFAAVGECIAAARRLGLRAWLYDEMPYPSGVAGGEVLRRRPEFVEQSLRVAQKSFSGGRRIEWSLGDGELLACCARRRGGRREVLDLAADCGPVADTWRQTDAVDSGLYYPGGLREGEFTCPRSICVRPQLRLATPLPAGPWEIVAVTMHRGGETLEPFGQYADMSNAEATALFLKLTHEACRARFGRDFGGLIPGIFTDEPKFRHPLPWGVGVAARVGKISAALAFALAGERGPAAEAERRRYRRAIATAFRESWTRPIARWCRRHRLAFTGHISPEEEWWYESRQVGSVLGNLRHFDVPGCDLIIPAAGDRAHAFLNLTVGLAVSAAAQAGRPQALCEAFGACDFTLDLRTMKRLGDWLACAGINVIVPHGWFYSLDGDRKSDAPPSFAPPAFAAADFNAWADAFRAAAAEIGPAVEADVLIVRPIDFLRGLREAEAGGAARLVARGAKLATELARRGLRAHWVDDDELAGVKFSRGRFVFGRCRYRHLVYFRGATTGEAARRLAVLGRRGDVHDDRGALRALRGPLASNGDVHAARRRDGRWFVANIGREAATFSLGAARGKLQAGESRVVDPANAMAAAAESPVFVLTLPDRWTVTRPARNTLHLQRWTLNGRRTAPKTASELAPGLVRQWGETLFGPVPLREDIGAARRWHYRTDFTVRGKLDLTLVCEEGNMRGEWKASLNGRPLRRWRRTGDFLRVHPLRGLVRGGANRLEFRFDIRRATDGMVGPCRLEGDFLVERGDGLREAISRGASATAATTRAALGLPHSGEPVDYGQEFDWRGDRERKVLLRCLGTPGGVAEVLINGTACGSLRWAPDELEVTAALGPAKNRIVLRLRGSPVVLAGRTDFTQLGCRVALLASAPG
jgi:hypothetical protein